MSVPATTERDHDILKVYYLPEGSGEELAARHPLEETGDIDEVIDAYRERGDLVIQVRWIAGADQAGDVVYQHPDHRD